ITGVPSAQSFIICGITCGGCCKSPSINTTASPRDMSKPALLACSFPKFRQKETNFILGLFFANSFKTYKVSSELPSLTKISSQGNSKFNFSISLTILATFPDSLNTGITMLINFMPVNFCRFYALIPVVETDAKLLILQETFFEKIIGQPPIGKSH